MSYAPIALFAFNRPMHLRKCLDSLLSCPEFLSSPLYVFIDGPRNAGERAAVNSVISIVDDLVHPDKRIHVQLRNRGLAKSITTEVSRVLREHQRIIVIEDDLVVHSSILSWFNTGLEELKNEESVFQIGGYQYSIPEFQRRREGTFQRTITTWGWATWMRAWESFDAETVGWQSLLESEEETKRFNASGNYPFNTMLRKLHRGEIDSWGIRWYYSVFKRGGLTLFPPQTLVMNEGMDKTATHNSVGNFKRMVSGPRPKLWCYTAAPSIPSKVGVNRADELAFGKGLRRTNALRNDKIKSALARLGFRRFA